MKSLVKNSADEGQVASAKTKHEKLDAILREDIRKLLTNPSGLRILKMVIDVTGLNKSTYSDVTNRTYYLEGQRSIGIYLRDLIRGKCPELLHLLEETEE